MKEGNDVLFNACRLFLQECDNNISSIKEDTKYIYNGLVYDIGKYRYELIDKFNKARTLDKASMQELYSQIHIDFLYSKIDEKIKTGRKKRGTKDLGSTFKKKEKKSCTIGAFRVEPSLYSKFEDRLQKFAKKNGTDAKKSDYLITLLKKDLIEIDCVDMITQEDKMKELRNLALQVSKIGNNVNQIALGINIIKRKKTSRLSVEDKMNIEKYYELLKILSERFIIVTKKITSMK